MGGLRTLCPVGKTLQYIVVIVQFEGCPPGTYGIWLYCQFTPPMHTLVVTSLSPVVEDIFWKVPVHFINCCSADSCDFGVLIRDSELRDFLHWQYGYPLQSSVNGPLDCIDSLATVNSAAMNIWVHEHFQNSISLFFFHIYTQVDLLDHTVVQFSVFRGIATLCSNSDCTSLHSHQLCWRIPFPPHPL